MSPALGEATLRMGLAGRLEGEVVAPSDVDGVDLFRSIVRDQ